jgi:hypothetical protein
MTVTHTHRRLRFYVEAALAVSFALTTALLLWRPDWIEALTGVDPDHGSGLAERILALVFGASTLLLSEFARREWGRAAAARTAKPVKGPA